jgi:four helix bundle protein
MPTQDLENLRVYQLAMRLGEEAWALTASWQWFEKSSMGLQLVRAADSVAANISEGYGRYSFKENVRFCYFARGSLRETMTWLTKAHHRKLVSDDKHAGLAEFIQSLRRQLDRYIRSIGKRHRGDEALEEDTGSYGDEDFPPLEIFLAELDSLNAESGPSTTLLTVDR